MKRGSLKKAAFKRLNALQIVCSYKVALRTLDEMGHNFDQKVLSWIDTQIPKDSPAQKNSCSNSSAFQILESIEDKATPCEETDLKSVEGNFGIDVCELRKPDLTPCVPSCEVDESQCPDETAPILYQTPADGTVEIVSFKIVGDNVDIMNRVRHQSRTHSNRDHQMFHLISIKDRVPLPLFDQMNEYGYQPNYEKPLSDYLPTVQDNRYLEEEFKIMIGKVICKYHEDLSWMEKHLPVHIPHENMKYIKLTSEVVSFKYSTEW